MSEQPKEITATLTIQPTQSPNDLKRNVSVKGLDMMHLSNHVTPQGISRERSFIRTSNPQSHQNNNSKRRSMGFQQHQQAQHMRKPLEIYRPPSEMKIVVRICCKTFHRESTIFRCDSSRWSRQQAQRARSRVYDARTRVAKFSIIIAYLQYTELVECDSKFKVKRQYSTSNSTCPAEPANHPTPATSTTAENVTPTACIATWQFIVASIVSSAARQLTVVGKHSACECWS